MRKTSLAFSIATACAALPAGAVYLNPEGLGQALIYPYYTARSAGGNAFNTYVSVANHTAQAKVVRVTFRESRNSRRVESFNLYLAANDMWTGAVVADGTAGDSPARLLTADASCTSPSLPTSGRPFDATGYTGANADTLGTELDRTREGWIEMIEMATLVGTSAESVTPVSGVPPSCASFQGTPALTLAAPTGGLSGTVTLINVGNGQDFAVNAEALAELTTQPFYRAPTDPYPAFDAAEITPVSTFTANGTLYRSVWSRGVDAVSAALMRSEITSEYVFDTATRSRTELVATFPTRSYYGSGAATQPPFSPQLDHIRPAFFNREARGASYDLCDLQDIPCVGFRPSTNLQLSNGAAHQGQEGVFGSGSGRRVTITSIFQNGLVTFPLTPAAGGPQPNVLTSLASSSRMDLATGQVTIAPHVIAGMPVVGFGARTFENGTLACGNTTCQGNYGGAFPFKYRRTIIAPVP